MTETDAGNTGELFSIGGLARRTGVPVRTIRFWSDAGIVPPTDRSAAGYRRYDATAVARLDLVRTLRELGLDLAAVRRILAGRDTLADVASAHVRALDAEIRVLRVRRAVLASVTQRRTTTEELRLMHELATLSARERQRLIDEFVESTFDGIPSDAPGAGIAQTMRTMPVELPDDPSPEQVDAWVELAELVADPGFRERTRQMALTGAAGGDAAADGPDANAADPARILEHAGGALAAGIAPDSPAGKDVLDRIVPPAMPAAERRRLAERIEVFTDRRVERYWQLLGTLNGWPRRPPAAPAFDWFAAALRAHS